AVLAFGILEHEPAGGTDVQLGVNAGDDRVARADRAHFALVSATEPDMRAFGLEAFARGHGEQGDAIRAKVGHLSHKLRPDWTHREVGQHRVRMDNLAHALVGAALGRAVADRHVPRAATIGIVAANAPDWTELFLGWPKWTRPEFLLMHRGITHSLIGALVETVALTFIIGGAWRAVRRWRDTPVPPWSRFAACVGVCVLSHLYMDWQGSYGWRPFLPWSSRWYYLDWVAIVDP